MSDGPTPGYFNVHKNVEPRERHGREIFVSPTDPLASIHKIVISFQHETSQQSVFFKAFISTLNETYSCDWAEETIYGRNDPSRLWKNTTRKITLGLKIPAETFGEAYDNLGRVSRLEQFLYPTYTTVGLGHTIAQGPYVRMKVMNLIAKAGSQAKGNSTRAGGIAKASNTSYNSYISTADPKEGLLGAITNLTVNHNLETLEVSTFGKDKNTVLPGLIELSVDFSVIHEKMLGWNQADNKFSFHDGVFPYGVTLMSDDDAATALGTLKNDIAANQNSGTDEEVKLTQTEQQKADAIARYSKSMPASVRHGRLKRDLEYMAKLEKKVSERNQFNESMGHNTQTFGTVLHGEELANYLYLKSAIGGVSANYDAYSPGDAANLLQGFVE
tara:strand:- start:793 stop:1953 length:1161 start_codon:yes stop_codon:yes gene_type:complete